jgi:predicted anti-sigma-YlaC factor YlaD
MKNDPSQWIHSGLTCREVTKRASEYLDSRLSIMNVRVGLHLASCASCRVYVDQLSLVSSALRNLPPQYPSALNRLRLRQRFAERHTD